MKKFNHNKDKIDFYFDLAVLSETSNIIYKKSVAQFIDNPSLTLENSRINLFIQLGQVAIRSQFAEKLLLKYAYLYDAFENREQSEIISNLQDLISDIETKMRTFSESESLFSQFREALKTFNKSIHSNKRFTFLTHKSIDDRNYLIHHCVIDNPKLLYDINQIKELINKAIYCNILLDQIIFEAEKLFNEAVSANYPEIGKTLCELEKSVKELINKP